MKKNHMRLSFDAISVNEAFARMAAAAFLMDLDPTLEELDDVKTTVSEAVTNAIIHAYPEKKEIPQVEMECTYEGRKLTVVVRDQGVGIADIAQARQPFYTSKPEMERSGMGFAFMEAFMDELEVESVPGKGTCVTMRKQIGGNE